MSGDWYKTVALVVSNIPILFAILSIGLRRKVRIPDLTAFALAGAASVFYHLCQQGDICLGETIDQLRPADHVFVWTLGFWVFMRILRFSPGITVSMIFIAFFFFTIFSNYLIASVVFPVTCGAFFICIYILRSTQFHVPLYHFGLFFFLWSLIFIGSGMFLFYLADDIHSEDFWIYHSIWHFLSETGIWFLYEAFVGTQILALLGLAWVYDVVYDYVEDAFEWEVALFDRRRKTIRIK